MCCDNFENFLRQSAQGIFIAGAGNFSRGGKEFSRPDGNLGESVIRSFMRTYLCAANLE
jgi:hypothetical protein